MLASTSEQQVVQESESISVRVIDAAGQHYVGVGLADLKRVDVVGSVGDYAFCGMENCECSLEGNAGSFFGYSIASGLLIAKSGVADGVAAMGRGGLVAVYGSARDRAAVSLRGADVIVRGNVGACAGYGMRSGSLVVGGTAGEAMGQGMRGGTIYLRGEAASISEEIEEQRLREPDRLKLGLLLLKAGIKTTAGKEFRAYRPKLERE